MSQIAKFPLKNGGVVAVEVEASDLGGGRVMRGSAPADALAVANDSFETALESVRAAAEGILDKLRNLAQPPDEVGVEFGVKMNAETGAIIAKASGEANFKISLTWKKSSPGK